MSILQTLAHGYYYLLVAVAAFGGGVFFGSTQQRRYLFRRSCARVALLRASFKQGEPSSAVELPGAVQLHRHVFSDTL
jgi:hypothetical protein